MALRRRAARVGDTRCLAHVEGVGEGNDPVAVDGALLLWLGDRCSPVDDPTSPWRHVLPASAFTSEPIVAVPAAAGADALAVAVDHEDNGRLVYAQDAGPGRAMTYSSAAATDPHRADRSAHPVPGEASPPPVPAPSAWDPPVDAVLADALACRGLPSGLHNVGNTCYANACLQCLFSAPILQPYLLSGAFAHDLHQGEAAARPLSFAVELAALCRSQRAAAATLWDQALESFSAGGGPQAVEEVAAPWSLGPPALAAESSRKRRGQEGGNGAGPHIPGVVSPPPSQLAVGSRSPAAPSLLASMQGAMGHVRQRLLRHEWTRAGGSVAPWALLRAARQRERSFRGRSQHDAQEFMGFALSTLARELRCTASSVHLRSSTRALSGTGVSAEDGQTADKAWGEHLRRENSVATALFTGQFVSTLRCLASDSVSRSFEPFQILPLPLPLPHPESHTVALRVRPQGPASCVLCAELHLEGHGRADAALSEARRLLRAHVPACSPALEGEGWEDELLVCVTRSGAVTRILGPERCVTVRPLSPAPSSPLVASSARPSTVAVRAPRCLPRSSLAGLDALDVFFTPSCLRWVPGGSEFGRGLAASSLADAGGETPRAPLEVPPSAAGATSSAAPAADDCILCLSHYGATLDAEGSLFARSSPRSAAFARLPLPAAPPVTHRQSPPQQCEHPAWRPATDTAHRPVPWHPVP